MLLLTPSSQVSQTGYRSSVIQTLDQFKALAEEWQSLLNLVEKTNIAMEHTWLVTWLTHFPSERLFIILVRNSAGVLVGVAPLKISFGPRGLFHRTIRHVQFIGTEPCVYEWMKILIKPGEDKELILREIAEQLIQARHLWDVLDLRFGLHQKQLRRLGQLLAAATFRSSLLPQTGIPYLQLPQTLEEYNATSKKRLRKKLQNNNNRLKTDYPDQAVNVNFFTPSHETEKRFDEFFQNHITYWAERGCRSDLKRFPNLGAFYKRVHKLYHSGKYQVLFSILRLGDEPISYEFGFWEGLHYMGHIKTYNPSFKRYSPGVLHTELIIRQAIECGGQRFALGRGEEGYKSQWANQHIPLWSLLVFRDWWSYVRWQADVYIKKALGKQEA